MADTNLHEKLKGEGYIVEQPLTVRKTVSMSEKGKRYTLEVSNSKESVVYQIDGHIITRGNKCDKLVLVERASNDWIQILVELKGVDVSHAIVQLESTLQNEKLKHPTNKEKRARIVAASFPANRGNTVLEKAKIRFRQMYQCDLRGLKSNQPDNKT